MHAFVDAGITTFDCADIYTGVEALIGDFVAPSAAGASDLQVHTKYVPDRSQLGRLTAAGRGRAVDRSLTRLGVEAPRPGAVPLVGLRACPARSTRWAGWTTSAGPGEIRHLGVTNFDTPTLTALLDAGLPIVSHQVQYSLLDRRPAGGDAGAVRGARRAAALLRHRRRRVPRPSATSDAAAPGDRARESLAGEVPADRRRGRRLGRACSALLQRARARGSAARGATSPRWPSPGCCSSRRSAAAIVGARHARHLPSAASRRVAGARSPTIEAIAPAVATGPPCLATSTRSSAIAGGRHAAVMRYELNTGAGASGWGLGLERKRSEQRTRGLLRIECAGDANDGVSDRHRARRAGARSPCADSGASRRPTW